MAGRSVFALGQSNRNAWVMLGKSSFFTIKVVIKLLSMYRVQRFGYIYCTREITFPAIKKILKENQKQIPHRVIESCYQLCNYSNYMRMLIPASLKINEFHSIFEQA